MAGMAAQLPQLGGSQILMYHLKTDFTVAWGRPAAVPLHPEEHQWLLKAWHQLVEILHL